MDAIGRLENIGYQFTIEGDKILYTLAPGREVDPATVKPMLEEMRTHKQDAISFLQQREQDPGAIYQQVADELARDWQAGTRQYIEQHRSELVKEIDTADAEVNRCWLAVDDGTGALDAFKTALGVWREVNLQAIRAYNDTLPLTTTIDEQDTATLGAACREHIRRKGFCLVKSQALGGDVIAVVSCDNHRHLAPKGYVTYTLREMELIAEGYKAGNIVSIGDLRLLHSAKKKLGGVILK